MLVDDLHRSIIVMVVVVVRSVVVSEYSPTPPSPHAPSATPPKPPGSPTRFRHPRPCVFLAPVVVVVEGGCS